MKRIYETHPGPQPGTVLTPEERLTRRKLMLRDAISLLTLFLITAVIFLLTFLLHRSFTNHEEELGERWKARGEAALRENEPEQAINSLRTALAYVPTRDTEIELATALAQAGRTTEATAYFNTLREEAPGDGLINLQLARLAAKQGDANLAVLRYQEALDGTWQANGYDRRRDVRLEMARYLITRKMYSQARNQLLIAESNAPEDDAGVKLEIAGLLEQAQDLRGTLEIDRSVAAQRGAPIEAVEAAGRVAFELGMYKVAAQYFAREFASAEAGKLSEAAKAGDRGMMETAAHILLLDPALDLPAKVRAQRILGARDLAKGRITACAMSTASPRLAPVLTRWTQIPARITVAQLEQQPDLEQTIFQLALDTESVTAQVCGAPTGDDALLLRIAENPGAVEQD